MGCIAPDQDSESLVLAHLNRQDGYILRRCCKYARRAAGARTETLIISYEDDDYHPLQRLDFEASFPATSTLVLRCDHDKWTGWAESFEPFVTRNLSVLNRLEHLDLGHEDDIDAPAIAASILEHVGMLTGLRRLSASRVCAIPDASWSVLSYLKHLTSFQLHFVASPGRSLEHIAAAAPQLRELAVASSINISNYALSHITNLQALASLSLSNARGNAEVLRSLSFLRSLTHLALTGNGMEAASELQDTLRALSKLTWLAALQLYSLNFLGISLQPVTTLQLLTSIHMDSGFLSVEQAQVVGALGALEVVQVDFECPAAAVAAMLEAKRHCSVAVLHHGGDISEHVCVTGSLSVADDDLTFFDVSGASRLVLRDGDGVGGDDVGMVQQLCRVLPSCTELRALQVTSIDVLHAHLLQAVASVAQLQRLHLRLPEHCQQLPQHCALAVLSGCSQLQQLTLSGMKLLSADTVAALMMMRCLRMLRLLGCDPSFSQEQAQAMVGQLRRWALQVDVVPDDGSVRAGWAVRRLQARWDGSDA